MRQVAVEEPYDPPYGDALRASGLDVRPIPVDGRGLRADMLVASDAQAVVVTPAHQFPTGAVLSPDRRAELIAWAQATGGYIVEDDYDAEFRYDREPVGAMQGLDREHVIYAGTTSKSLAPGLRLGWFLMPDHLSAPLRRAKNALDHGSGAFDQLILADVIERGEFDRQLRRMRAIYRKRRDAMLGSLATHLPDWQTVGASAGLHVLALLPSGVDEDDLVRRAAGEGIGIYGFSPYHAVRPRRGGIVFGYAATNERHIEEAVLTLASLLA